VPAVHGVVPFCVPAPVIATETVAISPATVPHAPPTEASGALVVYGKVRGLPLTFVNVTMGADTSTLIACAPLVPVLPAVSVWVAVTVYAPVAVSCGASVKVHAPAEHAAVPFWVAAPAMLTDTVLLSPAAVPQLPPTLVTAWLLLKGNVRTVPLTRVTATLGAVVSMVMLCAPEVPVLPAVSPCVAVTL
jgi:hypothetical protein